MTTAEKVKRSANRGTKNHYEYSKNAIRLASQHQSLRRWEDDYEAGWSPGHRFSFSDGSYLVLDGRGVITGTYRADQERREAEERRLNDDGWCDAHGMYDCAGLE